MKYQAAIALFMSLSIPPTAYADELVSKANQILSTTPEQAVKTAVGKNDFRFLRTPVCAEGMPGFDFVGYRGERPAP